MKKKSHKNGISTLIAEDWNDFMKFINDRSHFRQYIWRGQADPDWILEPTIDRELKKRNIEGKKAQKAIEEHLENFKMATRGRREQNSSDLSENDWWSLGQHYGLFTPLLDWTLSPFAAAYFSMYSDINNKSGYRVVYGISKTSVSNLSTILEDKIEFINPYTNENSRLVNQRGLFTRSPQGIDIESWCNVFFEDDNKIRMWKILIPEISRESALRSLNRMNINHLTLFPDIYGASKFANLDFHIINY